MTCSSFSLVLGAVVDGPALLAAVGGPLFVLIARDIRSQSFLRTRRLTVAGPFVFLVRAWELLEAGCHEDLNAVDLWAGGDISRFSRMQMI
jgi:hypothetical protein